MIQKSKLKKGKKAAALAMVFAALFFCVAMIDLDAGECEKALFRCLEDPFWHAVPGGPIYCATGYLFCKKYVEA